MWFLNVIERKMRSPRIDKLSTWSMNAKLEMYVVLWNCICLEFFLFSHFPLPNLVTSNPPGPITTLWRPSDLHVVPRCASFSRILNFLVWLSRNRIGSAWVKSVRKVVLPNLIQMKGRIKLLFNSIGNGKRWKPWLTWTLVLFWHLKEWTWHLFCFVFYDVFACLF